jgi:hypothetical protein
MRKIVDWSGDTPLYLTGGRVWFEALRKNFLIGVRFGKLLELQDIQNNSFFSLGVRKGDCWRCSYVQYMRLMKHMYAVKNFFIHPIKQNVLHRIQPSKTFVHQCLACYRYRVMLRCKSPFVRTNQPALQRVWQPRKKSRAYSCIKAGPHMFFCMLAHGSPCSYSLDWGACACSHSLDWGACTVWGCDQRKGPTLGFRERSAGLHLHAIGMRRLLVLWWVIVDNWVLA